MMNNHTEIGEIISVTGNILTVQLSDNVKSNMPVIDGVVYRIGQIGSFVKVPLGYSNLYGIVNQIGAAAIPESFRGSIGEDYSKLGNHQWLNMVLVGEQVGQQFERGIYQSPTTGDKVHLVTIKDLEVIYGGYHEINSIDIGNISVSESLVAKLNIDRLISRHSAFLGSTGSGKSNAVGVVLNAIANKGFKSSRVLVIDPHGEYNSTLKNNSNVYKIRSSPQDGEIELHIPFWALPFDELMDIFKGNLSDTQREYVKQKIREVKVTSLAENNISVEVELVTADSPIPFSLHKLWFELDDFERKTFTSSRNPDTLTTKIKEGDAEKLISNLYPAASAGGGSPFLNHQAKGIQGFLDLVKNKLKDSTYSFLFQPGEYLPDLNGKVEKDLSKLIHEWLGSRNPITILDLSGIPSSIMTSISGTLLKIVYDSLFWGQELKIGGKEQPLLIVLEEAHNYLKAGERSISSKTVQSIAKEGRKYGVGLALVTQRPSELNDTVLSQCGTIIALRMNNSKDRNFVSSALQDELQSMMTLLPNLRTGEGIISGEAVKIPTRIQFYKLEDAPRGTDPKASIAWMKDINPTVKDYEMLLNLWRNKITKEEN